MGWFILLGILVVVCGAAALILYYKCDADILDILSVVFATVAIVSLSALLVLPFTLVNKSADFNEVLAEYESTKMVIESGPVGNFGNENSLMEEILDLNKEIARHKAHANNWWDGAWFSEEIGNLEPLVLVRNWEQ